MSDVPVLTYFKGRGRAELSRIVLCAANVKFREVYLNERDEFLQLTKQGKLLFSQIPILETGGRTISQSGAIIRHVAREHGLYGANNAEAARVDELTEGTRDFVLPMLLILVHGDEATLLAGFKQKEMPKYLKIYNEVLVSNGTGFLVGKKLSLADCGLLEVLLSIEDYLGVAPFDEYDAIKDYLVKLKALPQIQNYLTNHRKGKNTPEYVATVKRVLGW